MSLIIDKDKLVKTCSVTLLIVPFVLFTLPQYAKSEYRLALVIGNGAYISSPLSDSLNDSQLMEKTLKMVEFEVIVRQNLTQKDMKSVIRDFGDRLKARKDSVGLFFFSGHGMQVGGRNYMIPVGASIIDESDVPIEGVPVDEVLTKMYVARNAINFVILDACRDNPFEKSFKSAVKGLGPMDTPKGTFIAYAAEPHKVALQGRDKYSIFTVTLAGEMLQPNIPVEKMFKNVRVIVNTLTEGRQVPVTDNRLLDDFYFLPIKIPVGPGEPDASGMDNKNKETKPAKETTPTGETKPVKKTRPVDNKTIIDRDGYFIAYRTGVVRETNTDLEWVAGPGRNMTWEDTKSWVETLIIGGGNWKMPNRAELRTLYQDGKGTHNMSRLLKPTGWWVWTEEKVGTNTAWVFNFKNGQAFLDLCDNSIYKRGFAVRFRERAPPLPLKPPRGSPFDFTH